MKSEAERYACDLAPGAQATWETKQDLVRRVGAKCYGPVEGWLYVFPDGSMITHRLDTGKIKIIEQIS